MKTKKLIWNDALAAYDRELDVLETTRYEYGQFIQQTIEDAAALVAKRFQEPAEYDFYKDPTGVGPYPFVAEWKLSGPRSIVNLVVQMMPSGPCGGASGAFLVILWLDTTSPLGAEFNLAELEATLLKASLPLDGEPYDSRKHPEDEGSRTLRVAAVDMGAADLPERLASHAVAYLKAAVEMADVVAQHVCDDAYRWVRIRLLELRALFPLPKATASGALKWESGEGLDEWAGGRYLGITRSGAGNGEKDDLWVCALPNGEVVFAGYGPFTRAANDWDALCALGDGTSRAFIDGSGSTLFDAAALSALAKSGRTVELRDRITALFHTFLGTPTDLK